ncbi:GntR family transcriptional regulator [Agromyces sp. MMS24-JH15]|uniref:GntR family transcriptional regulator n=1 Tax=Agromyces sp. MMS24-JH15 TaxID=3243765 RepID=UPI003749C681
MTDQIERVRRGVLAIARAVALDASTMPGEHELARRLEVNRPQIRKVLAQLEQQGIIRRHQGAATTVDPVALGLTVRLEEQLEHTALLDRLGFEPGVELLVQERITVDARLAETLEAAPGSPALRAYKRWTADGRPAMLADNVLLLPESDELDELDELDGARSLFELVESLWREPVVWEIATPGVENLDASRAALLDLAADRACMTLTIVGVLRSGRRVFEASEWHHPDIVRYSVVRRFPDPWG